MNFWQKLWCGLRSTSVKALAIKIGVCLGAFAVGILADWQPAIIICALLACAFIVIEANVKSVAYIFFFASFENMIVWWYQFTCVVFCITCLVLFAVKTCPKEKKQFLCLAIGIAVFLLYSLVISLATIDIVYGGFVLHLLMLFVLCVFRDEIDFKAIVYVFIAGIFVAAFFGLFVEVLPAIARRGAEFRAYGLTRFGALTGNPNRLHIHLFAAINGLFILDLKKQIPLKFFIPLLAVLFAIGFSTVARTFVLVFAINLVGFIVLKIVRDRRCALVPVLAVGLMVLVMCGVMYPYTMANAKRFLGIPEEEGTIIIREDPPWHEKYGTDPNQYMWGDGDVDDPGRLGIWERNLKEWLSSPKKFLFGNGFGSPDSGNIHQHNVFIMLLIKTGLVGVLVFAALMFSLFYTLHKVKKYKFNFAFLFFTLIVFGMVSMFEIKFPAISGFLFFFLYVFAIEKKEPAEQREPAEKEQNFSESENFTKNQPAEQRETF